MMRPKLVYCATPARMSNRMDEIIEFTSGRGYAPMHPFKALPYEYFEGNPNVGRKYTMKYCIKLIDVCDEFWMFGVSEGTLDELSYAIKINKPIKLFLDAFDKNWKEIANSKKLDIKTLEEYLNKAN